MEITSTGRRKTAAASVRMVAGSGKITVNGVAFEKYFETEALRGYIMQPLKDCNSETAFDISANIKAAAKPVRLALSVTESHAPWSKKMKTSSPS